MEQIERRTLVKGAALAVAAAGTAVVAGTAAGPALAAEAEPVTLESLAATVAQMQGELHDLKAKEAIRQKLALYARGLDRLDPDIAKAAFAEDSYVDYGTSPDYGEVFKGSGWDWCDYCAGTDQGIVDRGGFYAHEWYQGAVEVNGDKAGSEYYECAYVLSPVGDGTYSWMGSVARNCDKWECRDGDWVIVERIVTNDFGWNMMDAALSSPYGGAFDKTDPSYEALAYGTPVE